MASSTQQHKTAVAAWTTQRTELDALQETERKHPNERNRAARLSAGGKLANRLREIREIELDMALEGVEFEAFVPHGGSSKTTQVVWTEQDVTDKRKVKAQLQALAAAASTPDSVKKTANQRIAALDKAAKARGVTL